MLENFKSFFIAGAVAATMASAAAADNVTMNVGWATPLDSSNGVLMTRFKELLEEKSGGSIEVKLRCCGQISSEDDAFRALKLGSVDGYLISQNNVSPHWNLIDAFQLPYVFQNVDHLLKVANGPVGKQIQDQILADTGVYLLTFGGPSYRDFFNSKRPVNTIADMDGLKIRVPKNEVMLATFEAFGAEPVPLAWSETPTALQTRTIDGGDNGTNVIQEMKFFEFADHLTILDHFAGFVPLFASERFMGKLDDAQRAAVFEAALEAGVFHTQYKIDETEKVRAWLENEGGMTVTRPDRADFIAAAKTVQDEFTEQRGEAFGQILQQIRDAAE